MQASRLTSQFGIPNILWFEDRPEGLTRAVIAAADAEADLYLQGAHLTHWIPHPQRPVLFVSSKSLFVPGKAIRGGVPLIFPWFGARGDGQPGPAHGFARTNEWEFEGAALRDGGKVEVSLTLASDDTTRDLGYPHFHLRLRVTIGTELEMELETRNTGGEPLVYEEALHSYFAVGDVRQTSVTGLAGTQYIDKTDGFIRKTLGGEPLRLTKETDQMHLNTKATCMVDDPVWNRRIIIDKNGSDSTVVWNPWIDKTKGMPDMAADDWQKMLCVEMANVADNKVRLPPGAVHKMAVSIRLE